MLRNLAILVLGAGFATGTWANQRGTLDPEFDKIPFQQWLLEHDQTRFRWSVHVPHAELSFHQRLMTAIEIALDGRDLSSRRGDGQMVFFIEITDGNGNRYQDHSNIDLSKLDENIKAANIEVSQRAFFLPGEYQLAVAILDTSTYEHSIIKTQFRVVLERHDFLENAWRDLPPVEFIGNHETPDSWFLPDIRGRLQWAASLHSSARLNVILNVAASATAPGSHPTPSSGLAALLPTLKVISETGSSSVNEEIEALDLSRRRAIFHQNDVQELDWPTLKASLGDANTASIDVHSLSQRHQDAQFFVSAIRSILRSSEKPSVLVVLTTAVAFESGEDLEPISLEALPRCHVIYIRYRSPIRAFSPYEQRMGGRGRGMRIGGPMSHPGAPHDVIDQLEATLKPLSPKVFDVQTPEEMMKALIEIGRDLTISEGQSSR